MDRFRGEAVAFPRALAPGRPHRHPIAEHAGAAERGAAVVEYLLLLMLIVTVSIGAMAAFGGATRTSLGSSSNLIVHSTGSASR